MYQCTFWESGKFLRSQGEKYFRKYLRTFKKIFIGSLGITLAKTGGVIIFGNKV